MNSEKKQKKYLFTDLRHIRCGDLKWMSSELKELPLISPPGEQVEAHAKGEYVPYGIRLVAQKAAKTEPFQPSFNPGRIIYEDGLYRSWYMQADYPAGQNRGVYSKAVPRSVFVCYTESKDGFEWTKPKKCRIDCPEQTGLDGITFFLDPKGPSGERYKAVYCAIPPATELPGLWKQYEQVHPRHRDTRLTADYIYCMYGVVSPDGINWKSIREPLMIHKSDTDTTVYHDFRLDKYVMYTRLYWQERRWIGRAEADDFRHWGPVSPLIWPNLNWALSDDIYTNARTEYPGLPGYHLMFPMVYHRYTQMSDVHLFSSADGICWNEIPGGPVISPGASGEWDSQFIYAGKDLVPLGNDRVGLLYSGTMFPHKYPRWKGVLAANRNAWAWWPRGRLCAVTADEQGEFFTLPIVPAGRELKINIRTKRAGEVRVGLLDVLGRGINDCDPMGGDCLARPVHWKGKKNINPKERECVTLQFKLRSAELFGFEWV